MNVKTLLIVIMLFFTGVSCEKDLKIIQKSENTQNFIGSWINPYYSDSIITYEKSDSLSENNYGFSIKPGGLFIERKNSGWCGTPPICYADYEGTWENYDSILNITVPYWGGTQYYRWKVIINDKEQLSLVVLGIDYSKK